MEASLERSPRSTPLHIQGSDSELDPHFKDQVTALLKGPDPARCYQCGVCSASCPTIAHMEFGPRRIMHMVRLGIVDKVLRSRDIWFCVSCYACASRCPQGMPITDMMAALRNQAVARGLAKDQEATFSRVFVQVVERHGRMFEPELLLRYYAAEADPASLLKQAGLAIKMFSKGKIGLRPERIEKVQELATLVAHIRGEEKQ